MSYILDALRKSEAERQQGKAPGVSTVQAPGSFQPKRRTIWPYVVGVALIVNVASVGLALWFRGQNDNAITTIQPRSPAGGGDAGTPEPSSVPPPTTMPGVRSDPVETVTPTRAPLPTGGSAASEGSAVAAVPPGSTPSPAPDSRDKRAVSIQAKPSSRATDRPSPETFGASLPPLNKPQRATPAAEAKASTPATRTPPLIDVTPPQKQRRKEASKPREDEPRELHELPPAVRHEVPGLSVSFLVYSDQPDERMVTINGKRMREGDEVSEGLKLERITPEGVVLNWKGKQFHKGVF